MYPGEAFPQQSEVVTASLEKTEAEPSGAGQKHCLLIVEQSCYTQEHQSQVVT